MTEAYLNREQSELKHFALHRYLEAAVRILGGSHEIHYVDCCAGPWKSTDPQYRDTSFGIALTDLRSGLQDLAARGIAAKAQALFIEMRQKPFAELKAFVSRENSDALPLRAENWDFSLHTAEIARFATGPKVFGFILVDPKGWKLASIPAIEPLLKIPRGELLINLMSSFITRFVNDPSTDLSPLLGDDFTQIRGLSHLEREDAIVSRYCDTIRKVGRYRYVCALPIMDPDTDSFCFYLIYATRNIKGIKVFKQVEKNVEKRTHVIRAEVQKRERETNGSFDLFEPEVLYRERRYREFAEAKKALARQRVLQLLRSSIVVSYDECWAEALQIPAVYEADLRLWITEWIAAGTVRIDGGKPSDRVIKIESDYSLTYIPGVIP